jgi:VanZ family protein
MRFRGIMRWLTVLYIIILFVGAIIPLGSRAQSLNNTYSFHIRWDYLLHALIYLPMPVLMGFSFKHERLFWIQVIGYSLLITVLFETIQLLVPYRAFNINDMMANGIGVLIGLVPAVLVWRRFPGSEQSAHTSEE